MTTPAAEGPIGHFEQWAEKHLAPGLADIKTAVAALEDKGETWTVWAQAHAANAQQLAGLVTDAVKLIDPADAAVAASLVSRAQAIAAEADRLAAELLAKGV